MKEEDLGKEKGRKNTDRERGGKGTRAFGSRTVGGGTRSIILRKEFAVRAKIRVGSA